MQIQEKLSILEEIMELDEGVLKETDNLVDYDEWDSIAKLSFIAMMDSTFHKVVKGNVVKEFITVEDALKVMV